MQRRTFLKLGAAAGVSASWQLPAFGATATKVKAGYVHTIAVDGQLWLADSMKLWKKQNLDMEFIEFQNGVDAFQAMIGGSLDILATGAVVSHFPARGRGKLFLINDVEYATAQLWCHPEMGVENIADLAGKKVSTTTGTTAHVFLDTALRANGIDPKRVLVVNQRMQDAVTSFIAKAVPAIALWVPHDILIKERAPTARMLVDAAAYYPGAAIVGGWAARNRFHEKSRDVLARVIRAWADANDFTIAQPDQAIAILRDKYYPRVSAAELRAQLAAQKAFSSREWRRMYADGTVTNWLQRVTDFYVRFAAIRNPVPATHYFDTSLFLETIGT